MSAKRCMVQSLATIPPSTRRTVLTLAAQSWRMASRRSLVWKHTDSEAARVISMGPVLRVIPSL